MCSPTLASARPRRVEWWGVVTVSEWVGCSLVLCLELPFAVFAPICIAFRHLSMPLWSHIATICGFLLVLPLPSLALFERCWSSSTFTGTHPVTGTQSGHASHWTCQYCKSRRAVAAVPPYRLTYAPRSGHAPSPHHPNPNLDPCSNTPVLTPTLCRTPIFYHYLIRTRSSQQSVSQPWAARPRCMGWAACLPALPCLTLPACLPANHSVTEQGAQ
jgi:hypothetical protein